jgi:hypothetical protein
LQDKTTGGIFYAFNGTKAPIWDKIFLTTKFKNKKIIRVAPAELQKYQTVQPVLFGDGELIKSPSSPGVYLITNGVLRPFTSGEVFEKMGYKWANVITVSPKVVDLYPLGDSVSANGN